VVGSGLDGLKTGIDFGNFRVVSAGADRVVNEGTPVTLDALISDPNPADGGNLTRLWHVTASNGPTIADGTGTSFNFTPSDEGTYTVTANGATTTFTVPVTSPAAQPPALEATVEPPATPAPAATGSASAGTAVPEPTAPGLARYQPQLYRATACVRGGHDPALWQYVEDDGSGRRASWAHIPARLRRLAAAGPVGATPVATVGWLKRAWTIAQVAAEYQYSSPQGDIG
jgi:hypothetical protein